MKTKTFTALLEKDGRSLGWTIARLPFNPVALWPQMLRTRVCGSIGGFAFRTSLFAEGDAPGSFYLLVNRAMQAGAGARAGDTATFQLAPDLEPRIAELPEELDALLDEAEGLRGWYGALSEYTRRELGKWITAAKGGDARLRRAQQTAERLLAAMEAELQLPPLIERAFRARPLARAGWERTTPNCRRTELLALFYYQTPEARQRRLDKLCDAAEKRAG